MTITSETTLSGPYEFNGSAVSFGYGFKIFDEDEIVIVSIDDTTDLLTVFDPSAYSVDGVGDAGGGSIVFTAAPGAGATGWAMRRGVFKQETLLTDVGAFFPSIIMRMIDRVVMFCLELREQSLRSIRGRPGETMDMLPSAAVRANAHLAFDANGQPMA